MFWRKLGWVFALVLVMMPLGSGAVVGEQALAGQLSAPPEEHPPFVVAVDAELKMVYALPIDDQPQQRMLVGPGVSAAVGDFDGDGDCEVLSLKNSTPYDTKAPLTLYDYRMGAFQATVVTNDAYPLGVFDVGPRTGDTAVGDFDRDGRLDVAFSGRGCLGVNCVPATDELIQVILNKATGYVRESIPLAGIQNESFEQVAGLDSGEFTGDQFVDLAAQHYWEGAFNPTHILYNTPTVVLEDKLSVANAISSAAGGISSLATGDFNNDDLIDFIAGQDDDGDPGQTWFFAGKGGGEFAAPVPAYDTNPSVESGQNQNGAGFADAYDFNGDGNLDILTASEGKVVPAENVGLLLYLGNGEGQFSTNPILYNNESTNWFKVAAPPEYLEPCQMASEYLVRLPLIRKSK